MGISNETLAGLRREYEAEAREQLARLQRAVLDLEHSESAEQTARTVEGARREAHNIKGAAGSLGLNDVERLMHALESVLDRLAETPADVEAQDELLHAVDVAEAALTLLAPEQDEARSNLVMPAWRRLNGFLQGRRVGDDDHADADASGARNESVRISSRSLDELLGWVGDLILLRQSMASLGGDLEQLRATIREALGHEGRRIARRLDANIEALETKRQENDRQLTILSRSLRERLLELRLFPLADAFEPLRRAARDVARARGRSVRTALEPGGIRVDRAVLDLLRTPLIHLVRNAVDHGIEDPSARAAAGKDATGVVWVRGERFGQRLRVIVRDDGAGIDSDRVRQKAVERGFVSREEAEALSPAQIHRLLFRSGMSLAQQVDEISGRGVGLDVVLEAVQRGQGSIGIESAKGEGTTLTLELPVWLTSTRSLRVIDNHRAYAVSLGAVQSIQQRMREEIIWLEGRPWIRDGRRHLPAGRLDALLSRQGLGEFPFRDGTCTFVVLQAGHRRGAVAVDAVIGDEDLVVKDLGPLLVGLPGIAGGSIDSDGQVIPVLDATSLLANVDQTAAPKSDRRPVVVVADDVAATRSVLTAMLEAGGFSVLAVADGASALQAVEEQRVALAILDVRMRGMSGLDVCRALARVQGQRRVPVVLISAADEADLRDQAYAAGAVAFVRKTDLDPTMLLEIVRQNL